MVAACVRCGASIRFLQSATGRHVPVNAETTCEADKLFSPACGHLNHMKFCPPVKAKKGTR